MGGDKNYGHAALLFLGGELWQQGWGCLGTQAGTRRAAGPKMSPTCICFSGSVLRFSSALQECVSGQECGNMWQHTLHYTETRDQPDPNALPLQERACVGVLSLLRWPGATDAAWGFSVWAKECFSLFGGIFVGTLYFQVRGLAK